MDTAHPKVNILFLSHSLNPSLASIFLHITPPQKAMNAATSNEVALPQRLPSQQVRLEEMGAP